jgi:hypothetical protein
VRIRLTDDDAAEHADRLVWSAVEVAHPRHLERVGELSAGLGQSPMSA